MATARSTQLGAQVLQQGTPTARVTQVGAHILYKFPTVIRQTQLGAQVLQGPTPQFLPYLIIPQGESQSVNELDGHSSVGAMDVASIDPAGILRKLATTYLAGRTVRLAMGFPNMNIGDFVTLHTMQLLALNRSPEGLIQLSLADLQRFLMKQAWTEGGPDAWSPGDPDTTQPAGAAFTPNGEPVSDSNSRWLQGNPMDILLVACQNELGVGQEEGVGAASWRIYDPGDDSTLINPNPYLDVDGIISLRDNQFAGLWFEFRLGDAEDGKSWIEDQILKPLGLYWITKANGKLQLKSMKSPASTSPVALTDDNVIGTPSTGRLAIVNIVQLTPGKADRTSSDTVYEFLDEASDAVFNQQYEQDYQADGLRDGRGAFLLGYLIADKVFRRHAGNTPVYSAEVFLANVKIEIGDFVTLTHRLMLDLATGEIGMSAVLCEVIDRQPDYQRGRLSLKLADTRFMKLTTPFEIAPVGTPDYGSASPAQRAQYMFISGANGTYTGNIPGNTIF